MSTDRRTLFAAAGAVAAGAALAAGGAAAQPAPAANPSFYKTRIGSLTLTVLLDGIAIRQNPGEGFVRNADRAAVEGALRAQGLPTDRLVNPYCVAALETPRGIVLFDSGTGGHLVPTARGVVPAMQSAGLDPARVSMVVLTHYHGDHISGLTDAQNAAVFPNAEVVAPEPEHAFWTDPANAQRLGAGAQNVQRRLQPYEARLRRIAPDAEVAPGIRAVPTHGHTPGHTSYLVTDGADSVMVLGDLTSRPEINLRHPGWHVIFDMDAQMAEATRRRVFDRLVAEGTLAVGYHWPFPALGRVLREGEGYRVAPVEWLPSI
ncbi:MAG: MBL fold metallo-hydrolase [Acetobacteraceae bacterium]|nr:MBL fold metallo-hydrolase [Acetobacteraceae bacterium]